jgi:hypothetical protein
MTGTGAVTVMLAVAELPAPPVAVTAEVLLFWTPTAVPTTFTANVHDVAAVKVAPLSEIVVPPAVAVIVPPPQLPVSPFGVATARPDGNVSVKAMAVWVVPEKLWSVNVKDVDPPTGMLAAPKAFVRVRVSPRAAGAAVIAAQSKAAASVVRSQPREKAKSIRINIKRLPIRRPLAEIRHYSGVSRSQRRRWSLLYQERIETQARTITAPSIMAR